MPCAAEPSQRLPGRAISVTAEAPHAEVPLVLDLEAARRKLAAEMVRKEQLEAMAKRVRNGAATDVQRLEASLSEANTQLSELRGREARGQLTEARGQLSEVRAGESCAAEKDVQRLEASLSEVRGQLSEAQAGHPHTCGGMRAECGLGTARNVLRTLGCSRASICT